MYHGHYYSVSKMSEIEIYSQEMSNLQLSKIMLNRDDQWALFRIRWRRMKKFAVG